MFGARCGPSLAVQQQGSKPATVLGSLTAQPPGTAGFTTPFPPNRCHYAVTFIKLCYRYVRHTPLLPENFQLTQSVLFVGAQKAAACLSHKQLKLYQAFKKKKEKKMV